MGRKPLSNEELYNNLVETIKEKIEEQINDEYTEMKLQYLDNLEYRLEAKRNETVKNILDSIDVVFRKGDLHPAPTIEIKIVKSKEIDKYDRG